MERNKVKELVLSAISEYFDSIELKDTVNEETRLVGNSSKVDSIGLVNIIVDIEGKLSDEEIEISLLSEKAMSQKNSPFLNAGTMIDFIISEIN